MSLPSVSGLVLLLTFVLPGYLARSVANRKVPLPPVSDFGLLLQSFLISVLINVIVALAWYVVHRIAPGVPDPVLTVAGRASGLVPLTLTVAVGISLGAGLAVGSWTDLVSQVLSYGAPTVAPYYPYVLYTINPRHLTRDGESPVHAWVAVTLTNGETVTGRVREYGVGPGDSQSLVLDSASVWPVGATVPEERGHALVYVAGDAVARVEVYYANDQHPSVPPPAG